MDPDPDQLRFETEWSWYVHFPCASTNYGNSYACVGSFSTIADFWRLYNNMPPITEIYNGTIRIKQNAVIAYSLFRGGIKPEWEDPVNLIGSEWGCRETIDCEKFSVLWTELVLGAIGEHIPHCVGIRAINKSNRQRNMQKIEVWMNKIDTPSVQECRRSLSKIDPSAPRFTLMPHQEKQTQAFEYQRRRRKYANGTLSTHEADGEDIY